MDKTKLALAESIEKRRTEKALRRAKLRAGRIYFISREKAEEMAKIISGYTNTEFHPVEIMFKTFCEALTDDEKDALLNLLKTNVYPKELFERDDE